MDNCLRCQAESKKDSINNKDVTCVVCWGKFELENFNFNIRKLTMLFFYQENVIIHFITAA
jgi:hypothetical protein